MGEGADRYSQRLREQILGADQVSCCRISSEVDVAVARHPLYGVDVITSLP